MGDLWREDRGGCLLWCAFMFGCPGLAFLTIIIQDSTGFHLQNVEWVQSAGELVVYGVWIGGGGYLLIKFLESLGSSGNKPDGPDSNSTLDRGAGTMSWNDSGDRGSE